MLDQYIISKSRIKILHLFLFNPHNAFHVREIVRQTDEEINAVRRELLRMKSTNLLTSENRGNRVYYYLDKSFIFLPEFMSIFHKEFGLGRAIIDNKKNIGSLKFAVLSSSFIYQTVKPTTELDLLIVGNINMDGITGIIKEAEKELKKEINYTILSEEQFDLQKRRKDNFLMNILNSEKVVLIGKENDLLSGL